MKDALNYDINKLKEKQIISFSRVINNYLKKNRKYFYNKEYSKEIIDSIDNYLDSKANNKQKI